MPNVHIMYTNYKLPCSVDNPNSLKILTCQAIKTSNIAHGKAMVWAFVTTLVRVAPARYVLAMGKKSSD